MGANAQTTVPTFTASQVLTADQMNQSARTGVPVFADTTARDAAFGGSGEKTLAEGQLCYLESTNVVQYYDGAAWATVGPQTLTSGLNYITGASFSAVTSVSLPNSTFTSTYRNYRIVLQISNVANTTASTIRLRASGSDNTTSNYRSVIIGLSDSNVTNNSTSQGTSSWLGIGANTSTAAAMTVDVMAPQVTQQTQLFGVIAYSNGGYGHIGGLLSGNFIATTSFDALSFIFAGNTDGNYRVYGYADS